MQFNRALAMQKIRPIHEDHHVINEDHSAMYRKEPIPIPLVKITGNGNP
jgi:hypothetical protein